MFSTNSVKKFDIQEANKHLQLLHKRNAELVNELDLKSSQLSKVQVQLAKVEAQLEDLTKVKNAEVSQLKECVSDTETKLKDQEKETELWRMLVHERDVMIGKLQARCRGLEEIEGRLYECRPSLEALLGLIYDFDGGSEAESQNKVGPVRGRDSEEADYAAPDMADQPDLPPDLPAPGPGEHNPQPVQHTLPAKITVHPSNSVPSTSSDRVKHVVMKSVTENEKPIIHNQIVKNASTKCLQPLANSALPLAHSTHPVPLLSQSAPYSSNERVREFLMSSVAEYEELNATMNKETVEKDVHNLEEDLCNNFVNSVTHLGKGNCQQRQPAALLQEISPTENVLTKSTTFSVQESYPIVDL